MKRGVGLGLFWVGVLTGGSLYAATYNLYFNNIEQGDNSTAIPGVKVVQTDDGEGVTKTSDPSKPTPPTAAETPAAPPAQVAAPSEAATSVAAAPSEASSNSSRRVSMGVAGASPGPTGMLMIGYRPMESLGFRLFVGNNHEWAGADVEFTPLWRDVVEGKKIELRPLLGWVSFWDFGNSSGGVHAGLRAEVEIDKSWELFSTGRLGVDMASIEGGVTWKF